MLTAAASVAVLAAPTSSPAADLGGQLSTQDMADDYRPRGLWEGLYHGISGGYGWGQSDHNYERDDNHGMASREVEGALASFTLGYNFMVSPALLLGIEADAGVMDLSEDDEVIFDGHVWKTQFGPFWGTLRGRAGVVLGGILFYGTGGLAFMSIDEVGYGDADGQTAENRNLLTGWTMGGGMELALGDNVTTKIEYLHMDFGQYDGLSENQENYYFDSKVDIVRAGLNFRF